MNASPRRRGRPSQSDPRQQRIQKTDTTLHISQVKFPAPPAREIADRLADRAEEVCMHLLPVGRRKGRNFHAGNIYGDPGNSLDVCLEGPKAGRWIDHANPEHKGDLLHLWSFSKSITLAEAIRDAKAWLGLSSEDPLPAPLRRTQRNAEPPQPPEPPKYPEGDGGTYTDVRRLQELRNLPCNAGLEVLIRREILQFCHHEDRAGKHRAWMLIDRAGTMAQVRRLDGKPWDLYDSKPRSKTIKGCTASWPIGLTDAHNRDIILFTEGPPDMLAAACAAWLELDGHLENIGFCTITGSAGIAENALRLFKGKRVRIYRDADPAGRANAAKWYWPLHRAGAVVDQWESDTEGEDLNDFVSRTFDREHAIFGEVLTPQNLNL